MNARNRRTLMAIFARPTRSDVRWTEIEALMVALGCRIAEGNGSRVRFICGEDCATFHRPHPSPDTKKGAVEDLRRFLTQMGVQP